MVYLSLHFIWQSQLPFGYIMYDLTRLLAILADLS